MHINFALKFRILSIVVLILFGQQPAFAEIPVMNGAAVATSAPQRGSIEIADIPSQMNADQTLLQEMTLRGSNSARAADFKPEFLAINATAVQLGQHVSAKKLSLMSFSSLQTLDRHITFIDKQVSDWQISIERGIKPLADDIAQLSVRRALWRETLRENTGLLSPQLQKSIEQLDHDISDAELLISTPLGELEQLNHLSVVLRNTMLEQQKLVRKNIENTDKLLWNIDSPSLWRLMFADNSTSTVDHTQLADSLAIEMEFMEQSELSNRALHSVMIGFIGLLFLTLLWLAKQAKSLPQESMESRYRSILARPISAWLLLSAGLFIIENLNGSYLRLQILLALVWLPVVRLQAVRMHRVVGMYLYSTIIFIILQVLSNVLFEPFIFRLVLLLNATLICATMLVLFFRVKSTSIELSNRIRQTLSYFIGLAILLMFVSLVCNLVGNVHLAGLLVQGTVYSVYLGLFILATRNVVFAYVRFVLSRKASQLIDRTQHAHRLFGVSQRLFNLALIFIWIVGVLDIFRALRFTQETLSAIGDINLGFGSISITVGGVGLFCVSVYLSFWLAQTMRSILSEDVLPHMTLPRGVANSVSTMSYYFLLMVGLMVALTAAGFQMTQLAMVVGALSVGIGFGLQTVVNNFVSGLILMVERPIQPGDTVELSGTTGNIRDIGMRTTTLSTFDGADVVIPNGMLLSEKLTNWTLNNQRRRIEIPIGVSYDCDPRSVQALLLEVAQKAKGVSLTPAPAVIFMGFGDSSLDFSVRAWTDDFDQWLTIRSEMALEIHAALKAANVEIPYPQRDIHIRSQPQSV